MRHGILFAFALLLSASPAFSLQADLNKDGVVDFDDFFLCTDQFAQMGEPESADTVVSGDVDGITNLNLSGQNISLLDGLEHLQSLATLSLTDNLVVDLDPLQGLANLRTLTLASNAVRDIKPLADNPALATGSSLILAGNPLSVLSRTTYVRAMQDRGA